MDGCKQLNMEDAGFFSNKEPSFKASQLFFQQKLDTVPLSEIFVFNKKLCYTYLIKKKS